MINKRTLLQGLGAAVFAPGWFAQNAAAGVDKPALLLARHAPANLHVPDYLVSEKLDGVRAFWDGRRLLSRGGQTIALPAWFAERLPSLALDGELWIGRGQFDAASAAVRRVQPQDAEWLRLQYMLFELPGGEGSFEARAARLQAIAAQAAWPAMQAVPQTRVADLAALRTRLEDVVRGGGEGLMLHLAAAAYQTGRSDALLKFKPHDDDEAVVIAHLPGSGRLQGLLGALRVRNAEGQVFAIGTGLTDALRRDPPPVGATVSYRFRGLTGTGLPRFASFLRVLE